MTIVTVVKSIMKKRRIVILGLALMALSLSNVGCSAVIEQQPEEIPIAEYTIDVLPNGVYIKAGDFFYAPGNGDKTYTTLPTNVSASRLLWYTDDKEHVPEYKNGNRIIYKNNKTVPTSFVLEGFEHICDSIGIKGIRLNTGGQYVLSDTSNIKSTSDAYIELTAYLSEGTIVLDNIDGNSINSRMINKTGSISGLTKGQTYTLGFYLGTQYYEVDVVADTEIYCSKSIEIITRFEMTKSGYLVLQMPDLLTPGLYDIDNKGVVRYGGVFQE